jgi:murein endopeptidase
VSRGDGCGTELDDWFKKLRQAGRQSPAPCAYQAFPNPR